MYLYFGDHQGLLQFVFTGFQEPVNSYLDFGEGDQVAELQLKQCEAAKAVC